jgi:dynactin complex subunit
VSIQAWASLGAVVVSLLAVISTYLASRKASRDRARVEATKVDADAYARANAITSGLIDKLQAEVHRLNEEVAELRSALANEERENLNLRHQLQLLTQTANALRSEVANLTRQLAR